jgi:hypothetical protein
MVACKRRMNDIGIGINIRLEFFGTGHDDALIALAMARKFAWLGWLDCV